MLGALVEVKSDKMTWKNCWQIGRSGVLSGGDSGASVFLRADQAFLGVYVGHFSFVSDNQPLVNFVQDAYSLEAEVLRGWNITFRKEAI